MQIEEIKNGIHIVVRGKTARANKLRIKPGHIPFTGGHGELALRGGWGSLGSEAKIFLLTQKNKELRRKQRPRLGISPITARLKGVPPSTHSE
jgi:hypothetical protein